MLELFEASNGKEKLRIMAIDGYKAWEHLRELVGVKQWHGGYDIPIPHAWSVALVCRCGKVALGHGCFCSKACYDAATEIYNAR